MGVKQRSISLSSRADELANPVFQLKVLNGSEKVSTQFTPFSERAGTIATKPLEVLQINIGKLCNQSCAHCHVDAGPDKKVENMDEAMVQKCLELAVKLNVKTVDITGGAPEMNPNFRWFVEALTQHGIKVMNRCNLTIIMANEKYKSLPEFFAKNKVHVISSMPHYTKLRTDRQRGDGVYEDSILALKMLNDVGYGKSDTDLKLDLVYNPSGAFLPGDQDSLEREFKAQLLRQHGIVFNSLYAITNLPISRFLDYLLESGNYTSYMEELINAYNPATLDGLMCKNTMSVSWDGFIYDCDFNQMLDMKSNLSSPHIDTFDIEEFKTRKIVVNQHCYGCTAGAGSSCGGEII